MGTVADRQPDLSVIVVTHNRAELALLTLRSARAATRALEVQWIVVDSGSEDGTPEAIESAYADVRVLRERNVGFAAANNRGLELARGRYVLLLNPDVETVAGTYDELVAALEERPQIGVASVVQNAPDGRLQHSIRRFPSPWLAFGEALAAPRWTPLRGWREEEPRARRYRSEAAADWLVGAFLIARAQALADVGGLDERFFLYSEETDWCYRFHRAGWEVAHLPVMAVTHHTGQRAACRPVRAAELREGAVRAQALRRSARGGDPRGARAAPRAARRGGRAAGRGGRARGPDATPAGCAERGRAARARSRAGTRGAAVRARSGEALVALGKSSGEASVDRLGEGGSGEALVDPAQGLLGAVPRQFEGALARERPSRSRRSPSRASSATARRTPGASAAGRVQRGVAGGAPGLAQVVGDERTPAAHVLGDLDHRRAVVELGAGRGVDADVGVGDQRRRRARGGRGR